jgi:hypothetical protein
MDDDVADDIEKIRLIIDIFYVDWMMRWIEYMSRELYLSIYSGSYLYSYRVNLVNLKIL